MLPPHTSGAPLTECHTLTLWKARRRFLLWLSRLYLSDQSVPLHVDLREVDVGSQLACGNTVKGQGTILVRKVRDYGKNTKKMRRSSSSSLALGLRLPASTSD